MSVDITAAQACQQITTGYDPVPELQALLGPAVFLKWPRGLKGLERKWGHLRLEHMTPHYLADLRNGNIGVALGEVSGGLCAIDFDVDEYADAFLALNPALAGTLQTHGNRGRVFWLRFKDQYPRKSPQLESHSKEAVGEFRSNGNQSIVWGIHPDTQRPYQFVTKAPVAVIDFSALCWPSKIANPPGLSVPRRVPHVVKAPCSHSSESTRPPFCSSGTHLKNESGFCSSGTHCASADTPKPSGTLVGSGPQSLEVVLKLAQPHRVRTNNRCLFVLARGMLSLERNHGRLFTESEADDIFYQWYKRALPFLRKGRSELYYLEEFRRQRREAKHPIGGDAVVEAWRLANDRALPPEAAQFKRSQRIQLLTALCFHLQNANGSEPFFLSPYDIMKLFNVRLHTLPDRWMKRLCSAGVLKLVEPGSFGKGLAARYRYVGVNNARVDGCPTSVTHSNKSIEDVSPSQVVGEPARKGNQAIQ